MDVVRRLTSGDWIASLRDDDDRLRRRLRRLSMSLKVVETSAMMGIEAGVNREPHEEEGCVDA
jgi:hypothetical protein